MCGIVGFNWDDATLVEAMTERMANRGPDDCGTLVTDHVSLGHRRLSVIDLSAAGNRVVSWTEYRHRLCQWLD